MGFNDRCWLSTIDILELLSRQTGVTGSWFTSKTISKIMGKDYSLKPDNPRTAINWHGVLMEHNVANDGVPGVSQCTPSTNPSHPRSNFPPRLLHLPFPRNILRHILVPQPL